SHRSFADALEGALGLAFRVALGDRLALVVRPLASPDTEFDLHPPVPEVAAQRHERGTLLRARLLELVDLTPVKEQLAPALGVEFGPGERVRSDVHAVEPHLAALDARVGVSEVGFAIADRLHLAADQRDPALVRLVDEVVVARTSVHDRRSRRRHGPT